MKLTREQGAGNINQAEVQAIPDSHPAIPQLNELFGDHTFLLDSNGLNILEPAEEAPRGRVQAARVVNLANWSDENLTRLAPIRKIYDSDRKSTRLNSSHQIISYAVFCLKKKKKIYYSVSHTI